MTTAHSRRRHSRAGDLKRSAKPEAQQTSSVMSKHQLTPQQEALVENFDGESHHGDVIGINREERERLGFHMSVIDVHIPRKQRRKREIGAPP